MNSYSCNVIFSEVLYMEYPYREKFLSWAKDVKHYRESTVMLYDYTVNSFYNYFYSQSEHGNDIRLVRP